MLRDDFKLILESLVNFNLRLQPIPTIEPRTKYFGLTDPNRRIIYVCDDLSEPDRIATLLHECRHAYGFIHRDRFLREREVEKFAQELFRRLYK